MPKTTCGWRSCRRRSSVGTASRSNRQRGSRLVAGIVALVACSGVWIVGRTPAPLTRGIVATLAEYVVNEGGTSPAGSIGALVYEAKTGKTEYLDAEFNGVLDPAGRWDARKTWTASDREAGKAVLVP